MPIGESVGASADLVRDRKVLHIGSSVGIREKDEASAPTPRRAPVVHPNEVVHSEFSLFARDDAVQGWEAHCDGHAGAAGVSARGRRSRRHGTVNLGGLIRGEANVGVD